MADPASSNSGRDIFVFLITTIPIVVQMHFPSSSPSDKHSANVWIFIVCLFFYGFSSSYYKIQVSTSNTNDTTYFKISSHIAVISGSTACAALISMLVSKPVLALIIIIYLMWLFLYFAPSPVNEICKKLGSYVSDMCKGSEHKKQPGSLDHLLSSCARVTINVGNL